MKLEQHIAVSTAVSAIFLLITHSIEGAISCFLVGIFIDLDHVFDYLFNHGTKMDIRRFFNSFKLEALDNIFVFLHSWEIMAICLVVAWLTDWKPVILGILVGGMMHLVLDHFWNGHSTFAYWLFYRMRHRFAGRYFYGAKEYRERLKFMKKKGINKNQEEDI
jgi:hypothetical protein